MEAPGACDGGRDATCEEDWIGDSIPIAALPVVDPDRSELVEFDGSLDVGRKAIDQLLCKYLENGDREHALQAIQRIDIPFRHDELVRRALLMGVEGDVVADLLECLGREDKDVFSLSNSKNSTGSVEDGPLTSAGSVEDGPLISTGSVEDGPMTSGMTCDSGIKDKLTAIIHEYFSSDDVHEVLRSLEDLQQQDAHAVFIKKLILLAMERKNREKEMASVLLPSLEAETEVVAKAFAALLAEAKDTGLDIPDAASQLAFFLARAVFDDVLPPFCLEEIKVQFRKGSMAWGIVGAAKSMLSARHGGERIMRCWGGGSGWAIEDAKEKIAKMLEEYELGGDTSEACRCIRDVDMPFFHHEVVKRSVEMALEKPDKEKMLLNLLQRCSEEGLVTTSQMSKGFHRVLELLDDLALDVLDAESKFWGYVDTAKQHKWLSPSFNPEC